MIKHFIIWGDARGKQRPRVTTRGGTARTYTPEETVNYESMVKLEYMRQTGPYRFEGPLYMSVTICTAPPQSVSNAKRLQMLSGDIRPERKPDLDNVAKIICDALNNLAYRDDKQIVDLWVKRYYAVHPGVCVVIGDEPIATGGFDNVTLP